MAAPPVCKSFAEVSFQFSANSMLLWESGAAEDGRTPAHNDKNSETINLNMFLPLLSIDLTFSFVIWPLISLDNILTSHARHAKPRLTREDTLAALHPAAIAADLDISPSKQAVERSFLAAAQSIRCLRPSPNPGLHTSIAVQACKRAA